MRYCTVYILVAYWAAKLHEVKVEGQKEIAQATIFAMHAWGKFFGTSSFQLLQFCSPLSHTDAQYLILNSLKILNGFFKSVATLWKSDIFIQSNPIYLERKHNNDFVQ